MDSFLEQTMYPSAVLKKEELGGTGQVGISQEKEGIELQEVCSSRIATWFLLKAHECMQVIAAGSICL